ncbi:MAG TPA: hypothetical protein PKB14_19075 [Rubrivivax sp.]|nr:hypothetical protein [Rubrivivax sp.]
MTKGSLGSKYKSLMVRKDPHIDYAAISAKKNAPRWIRQLALIGKWPAAKTPAAATAT